MAELLLKVGSVGLWDDGDVINALTDRHILAVHAQHLCHVKLAERNDDGLITLDSLRFEFEKLTSQYHLRRISPRTVLRTEQATGRQQKFTSRPVIVDGCKQHIFVAEYVERRMRHPRNRMFGHKGREQWFGGRTDYSAETIDDVWSVIAARTGEHYTLDEQYRLWPMGRLDLMHHCPIRVLGMEEYDRCELESAIDDGEDILARRAHRVDIDSLPGLSCGLLERIRDYTVSLDLRRSFAWPLDEILVRKEMLVRRSRFTVTVRESARELVGSV